MLFNYSYNFHPLNFFIRVFRPIEVRFAGYNKFLINVFKSRHIGYSESVVLSNDSGRSYPPNLLKHTLLPSSLFTSLLYLPPPSLPPSSLFTFLLTSLFTSLFTSLLTSLLPLYLPPYLPPLFYLPPYLPPPSLPCSSHLITLPPLYLPPYLPPPSLPPSFLQIFLLPLKYNIRVEDIMVRDVRYITLNCCYRDLHNVLLTGNLKTLALVESADQKIFLMFKLNST
ncbi:Chloride channel protein 1 [Merluccius polli]|uniref:Chloride channel protein 1 n=1 Tax=Merluccius polli TaxID=89951 RepID=A0AA47MXE1_MERPO|nr:Chloride channel protein 1 [Merluccius polli]